MTNALPLLLEPEEFESLACSSSDIDLCIVDLSSEASYLRGHIPGAIHIPPQAIINGAPPCPGKLPSTGQLQKLFSYLGLNKNTHFVVYDDEGGGWAGRFIWTLDVIGHTQYSYINGGILAWRATDLPLETEASQREKTNPEIKIHEDVIAEIPEILQGIEDKSITVWDARSPEEYRGERILASKSGHIPTALNCEWTSLMNTADNLKILENSKDKLDEIGITGEKPIITHCQSHHRSGFTYLVGKILGFEIKGYHGSWAEWGNHPSTPVEL